MSSTAPPARRPTRRRGALDNGGGCGAGTLTTNTQDPQNAALDGNGNLAINAIDGPTGYTSAQLDSAGKSRLRIRSHRGPHRDAGRRRPVLGVLAARRRDRHQLLARMRRDRRDGGDRRRPRPGERVPPRPRHRLAPTTSSGAAVNARRAADGHLPHLRADLATQLASRGRSTASPTPASRRRAAEEPRSGSSTVTRSTSCSTSRSAAGPARRTAATAFPATMRVAWVRLYQ